MDAYTYWHMTPREINGRIRAFATQHDRLMQDMDLLAYMTGAYSLTDPKKYPKKPNMIKITKRTRHKEEPEAMPPDEMKDRLTLFADINNQKYITGGDGIGNDP